MQCTEAVKQEAQKQERCHADDGTVQVAGKCLPAESDGAVSAGQQERKRKEAERQAVAPDNGEEHPAAAPPAEAAQPPAAAPTAILRRPTEPRTLAAVAAANADQTSSAEVLRLRPSCTHGQHIVWQLRDFSEPSFFHESVSSLYLLEARLASARAWSYRHSPGLTRTHHCATLSHDRRVLPMHAGSACAVSGLVQGQAALTEWAHRATGGGACTGGGGQAGSAAGAGGGRGGGRAQAQGSGGRQAARAGGAYRSARGRAVRGARKPACVHVTYSA